MFPAGSLLRMWAFKDDSRSGILGQMHAHSPLCLALPLLQIGVLPAATEGELKLNLRLDLTDAQIAARVGFLEQNFDAALPGAWRGGEGGCSPRCAC